MFNNVLEQFISPVHDVFRAVIAVTLDLRCGKRGRHSADGLRVPRFNGFGVRFLLLGVPVHSFAFQFRLGPVGWVHSCLIPNFDMSSKTRPNKMRPLFELSHLSIFGVDCERIQA